MQSVRVAAASINGGLGNPSAVLETIDAYCGEAVAAGARLIVFPELVIHGHCTPNTWELAEPVPDGPSTRRLVELAHKHGLYVSAGLSEKEDDLVYNTQVVAGPDGYLGKQRKLHLSRDEVLFYKGGREITVFDLGSIKAGIVICYDNQFPEVARICALKGAEILLMPHAAREAQWDDTAESEARARKHMFEFYKSCYAQRARENACFAMIVDQAGRAGIVDAYPPEHPNQPHHPGGAIIFDPWGKVVAHTQTEQIKDEIIVADLDAQRIASARSHPNFTLRTRRPELFAQLVQDQVSS